MAAGAEMVCRSSKEIARRITGQGGVIQQMPPVSSTGFMGSRKPGELRAEPTLAGCSSWPHTISTKILRNAPITDRCPGGYGVQRFFWARNRDLYRSYV